MTETAVISTTNHPITAREKERKIQLFTESSAHVATVQHVKYIKNSHDLFYNSCAAVILSLVDQKNKLLATLFILKWTAHANVCLFLVRVWNVNESIKNTQTESEKKTQQKQIQQQQHCWYNSNKKIRIKTTNCEWKMKNSKLLPSCI